MKFFLLISLIPLIKSQLPNIPIFTHFRTNTSAKLSKLCEIHLKLFVDDFFRFKLWSLQMADASSKLPSGILKGNLIDIGDYDECLAIQKNTDPKVSGKFCIGSLSLQQLTHNYLHRFNANITRIKLLANNPNLDLFPKMSFCVPASCSAGDLQKLFGNYIHFVEEQCFTKASQPKLDNLAIFVISLFSFVFAIVIMSTIYDICLNKFKTECLHPLATTFSAYTNCQKLFNTTKQIDELQCLNGLKALSMVWVVLGHVYMAYIVVPLDNYTEFNYLLKSMYSPLITAATFAVDSFLLIGGFLTVYTFQKMTQTGRKFNIFTYYLHRYLRLTPSIIALLLAYIALFNYFGSGPFWINTDIYLVKGCRDNWWKVLLYIQNYGDVGNICIPQSWYLAVDMQIYLLSPLILLPLQKKPKCTITCVSLLIVMLMFVNFLIGWIFRLKGTLAAQITEEERINFLKNYYFPSYTRVIPYLIGMMLGFFTFQLKKTSHTFKMNNIIVVLGWVISATLIFGCIFSAHSIEQNEYNRFSNSFYIALARPIWALAVSWIVFVCIFKMSEPINWFLSLPIFKILVKLSYGIFLVHYSFIFMTNFSQRKPLHFTIFNGLLKFWGDFAFSAIIAVFWTLAFESPIIRIEKYLLEQGKIKEIIVDKQKV